MRMTLGIGAAAMAAALLGHAPGLPAGIGMASAAPPGTRPGLAADGAATTLAQFRDRADDDELRRRRDGTQTDTRDRDRDRDRKRSSGPGPGGDGKKHAKGTGKWHSEGSRRGGNGGDGLATGVGIGLGAAIGGAIVSGAGQCAAQSDRCTSRYGKGNSSYRRCMSDGGC